MTVSKALGLGIVVLLGLATLDVAGPSPFGASADAATNCPPNTPANKCRAAARTPVAGNANQPKSGGAPAGTTASPEKGSPRKAAEDAKQKEAARRRNQPAKEAGRRGGREAKEAGREKSREATVQRQYRHAGRPYLDQGERRYVRHATRRPGIGRREAGQRTGHRIWDAVRGRRDAGGRQMHLPCRRAYSDGGGAAMRRRQRQAPHRSGAGCRAKSQTGPVQWWRDAGEQHLHLPGWHPPRATAALRAGLRRRPEAVAGRHVLRRSGAQLHRRHGPHQRRVPLPSWNQRPHRPQWPAMFHAVSSRHGSGAGRRRHVRRRRRKWKLDQGGKRQLPGWLDAVEQHLHLPGRHSRFGRVRAALRAGLRRRPAAVAGRHNLRRSGAQLHRRHGPHQRRVPLPSWDQPRHRPRWPAMPYAVSSRPGSGAGRQRQVRRRRLKWKRRRLKWKPDHGRQLPGWLDAGEQHLHLSGRHTPLSRGGRGRAALPAELRCRPAAFAGRHVLFCHQYGPLSRNVAFSAKSRAIPAKMPGGRCPPR